MKINRLPQLVLFIAVLTGSLTACKKGVDPVQPADLADRVTGQYTLSQLTLNGKTYAASDADLKGSISISRQTASSVSMLISINQQSDNTDVLTGSVDGVMLTDAGNGEANLTKDGDLLGRGSAHKLVLNSKDQDNVPFTLILTK